MIEEIKRAKNPFEVVFNNYNEEVDQLFDRLINEAENLPYHTTLTRVKQEVLKCAFAVLSKHVLEEAHGNYPFTDFQELIRETNLQRWQHESWYLFGAEGIKWREDFEWQEAPFVQMMEKLIIKYVAWWGDYLREHLSQEERIKILSVLLGGFDVASSHQYMQSVNFYIRPLH